MSDISWNSQKYRYDTAENDRYTTWVSGTIVYSSVGCYDALSFADSVVNNKIDYNELTGWFKIVILDKQNDTYWFLGDNAGSQYFFLDEINNRISDSFLSLVREHKKTVTPDYLAIADVFNLGTMLNNRTLVKEIKKADEQYVYGLKSGKIEKKSKELLRFGDNKSMVDLSLLTESILEGMPSNRICAVCTGGTDSRCVISLLTYKGINPQTVITGHGDNPDIAIAKKISDKLKLKLSVLDPGIEDEDWIGQGAAFVDGMYDAVLSYRHLKKGRWAAEHEFEFEFGGVAGEIYKNDFCRPIRWPDPGKNYQAFYYSKLLSDELVNAKWCDKNVMSASDEVKSELMDIARLGEEEDTYLAGANRVGYELLKNKAGAITNGYSSKCTKVDLLMDRRLVSYESNGNPWTRFMHMWQRKVVSRYCKKIASIRSDQGYTLSTNVFYLLSDYCIWLFRFAKRVLKRLTRRFRKNVSKGYWQSDYSIARETARWSEAINICKSLHIIKEDAEEKDIPLELTGWILLIGYVYDKSVERQRK